MRWIIFFDFDFDVCFCLNFKANFLESIPLNLSFSAGAASRAGASEAVSHVRRGEGAHKKFWSPLLMLLWYSYSFLFLFLFFNFINSSIFFVSDGLKFTKESFQ